MLDPGPSQGYFPLILAMFFLLAVIPPCLSASEITPEDLAGEIAAFFPVIEGYIAEVKGDRVFLDLDSNSGVKAGMEFLCIREGEEFTHPVTGTVLGRFEDKLGIIQVVEVKEKYSIAKILERFSGQVIRRGDKIRINAAKVPVALPPDLPSDPSLDYLVKGLNQSGRFTIISRKTIINALQGLGSSKIEELDPARIKKMGEDLDIAVIIFPALEDENGKKILHVQIVSARTGVTIAQISHEFETETSAFLAGQPASYVSSGNKELNEERAKRFKTLPEIGILGASSLSQDLPVSIRYMAIGDVTGDGKNEICITDGQDITLFSWDKDRLKTISHIKGKPSEGHLSLDIADINDNGKAEVFVCNMEKETLRSFALEWEENGLKRIWDAVPLFLRVMPIYPDQKILLGQSLGITEPFDNRIHEYDWVDGKYAPVRKIEHPDHIDIFDICMADFDGDGHVELACLMDNELVIYRNGEKIWKSNSGYGAKTTFFEHQTKGPISLEEERTRVYLSSHLNLQDMNANGKPDLMLIKNISSAAKLFPQSRFYRQGEACLIEWNGISYGEIWCSGKIDAYLTDIGTADIDLDGSDDLVLSMVLLKGIGKFWEKSRSKVLVF